MTWIARYYSRTRAIVPMPRGIQAVVLAPRHRAEVLVLLRRQRPKNLVPAPRQTTKCFVPCLEVRVQDVSSDFHDTELDLR